MIIRANIGLSPKLKCVPIKSASHSKNLTLDNALDIPMIPPNQINVFQAPLDSSISSHLITPVTSAATMATIATAVASRENLMPKPCVKMEGNAQPTKARIKIAIRDFSRPDIGPSSFKPSSAIA